MFAFAALFSANQASAYYSPSTGHWLSRDPMGEPGFEALRASSRVPIGRTSVFLSPGKRCVIEVIQDQKRLHEDFPQDWFVLKVKDQNEKLVASKAFYSTYQEFHIYIVDLDGDGRKEFLFELGEGRGTRARRELLDIERLEGSQFTPILTTPLSDFYASGRRWWYAVEFKPGGDGTTDV